VWRVDRSDPGTAARDEGSTDESHPPMDDEALAAGGGMAWFRV